VQYIASENVAISFLVKIINENYMIIIFELQAIKTYELSAN